MIGLESTRETKIEKKKKTVFIYLLIWMIELLKKKNYRLADLFKGFIKLDRPKKYILFIFRPLKTQPN